MKNKKLAVANEVERDGDAVVESLVRHGLTYDHTGTGHDRITCLCGKTIVCQPWMTDAVWRSRVRVFKRNNHGEPITVGAFSAGGSDMKNKKAKSDGAYKVSCSGMADIHVEDEMEARRLQDFYVGSIAYKLCPKTDGSGYEWRRLVG